MEKLWQNIKVIENSIAFKNIIRKGTLEKIDRIIIADFDDTIFCRKEQLEQHYELKINRWKSWVDYVLNELWINNFTWDYYKWKDYPDDIVKLLNPEKDLILTAGNLELQEKKLEAVNLQNYNHIITPDAVNKPEELVKYLLERKILANEIVIYEDKPENFSKKINYLRMMLPFSKIIIKKVEMNWNHLSPKIYEI